jgi:Phosphotransferase system, galactitol-specific IIC component
MQWLLNGISWLQGLGASVMLPIVIFILALILGAKPGKAFRAALTIGVAFIGINLVLGVLGTYLGGATQAMVTRLGTHLDTVDVGWPAAAAIAFGGTVGVWIIPLCLVVNIVMLLLRGTKTLNVDIWNFWHFAFTGSLVYAVTKDLVLSLGVAALNAALVLWMADWTAPGIQALYNLPGISIPHGFSLAFVPFGIVFNWICEKIPGLNKLEADPDTIQKRFGVLGEPLVMGTVLGFIIGCFAYLGDATVGSFSAQLAKILIMSINLGAVMLLLPRMVAVLMEGLIPVSQAAGEFMQKHFHGGEFYIGLDSAVLVGHPSAIALGLILAPVTILLAIGLSALGVNRILPFTDLAVLPFLVCMIAPITRGNIVRGLITGIFTIALSLILGSTMIPLFTSAAMDAKFQFPAGATNLSSICDGSNPLTWLLLKLTTVFNNPVANYIGLALGFVILAVIVVLYKRNAHAWEVLAGAPAEEAK